MKKRPFDIAKNVNFSNQNNLSVIKRNLTDKLYDFNRDKDKLDFLSVLERCFETSLVEHESVCPKKTNCTTSDGYRTIIFAIKQEFEDISNYYSPEVKSEDEFTADQEINLRNKIEEVLSGLTELKMGQEIIYEELDILRQHFNLGKKSWFQLLKSKLVDVVAVTALEKGIAEGIYNQLYQEVSNVSNYIETQF